MGVEVRAMPSDRLPAWIEEVRRDYEQSRIDSGEPAEVAARKARTSLDASFPDGRAAPGHLVYDVIARDDVETVTVGYLWVSRIDDGTDAWWVSDIKIDEEHRGKGYGRAAMELAETVMVEHGAATSGLNVFGYNTAARSLYESLGYEITAVQLRKPIGPVT